MGTLKTILSIVGQEQLSEDLADVCRVTTVNSALSVNNAKVWSDVRTTPATATTTYYPASLQDSRGTVTLTALNLVYVKNKGTATLTLSGTYGGIQTANLQQNERYLFTSDGGRTVVTSTFVAIQGGEYEIAMAGT